MVDFVHRGRWKESEERELYCFEKANVDCPPPPVPFSPPCPHCWRIPINLLISHLLFFVLIRGVQVYPISCSVCTKYTKEFLSCSLPLLEAGKTELQAYGSCVVTDEEKMLYKYVGRGGENRNE